MGTTVLDIWGYPWSPLTVLRPPAPENNQWHQAERGPGSVPGPGLGLWGVACDLADWILWFWRRRCQRELRVYSQAPLRQFVSAALLPGSLSGAPWESHAVIYGCKALSHCSHVYHPPGRGRCYPPRSSGRKLRPERSRDLLRDGWLSVGLRAHL